MTRIGLLSDTHSFLDERLFEFFEDCDEIWHAGDIGDPTVADQLEAFRPFRAVYGNIDGGEIRARYPLDARFDCAGLRVWMTDRKSTRLNSSHPSRSRMPSSA